MQTRRRHAHLFTVTDRQPVWIADVLNPWLHEIIAAGFKLSWTLAWSSYLWTIMVLASQLPHPQPGILRSSVFFLKGLWNVEQILSALSAWTSSPLAELKSQGPVQELTEFHMEARNTGTSCLSPTRTLICRCLVNSLPSCFLVCQAVHICSKYCLLCVLCLVYVCS